MEKKNIRIQKGKKGMSRIRRNSELELQYNSPDIRYKGLKIRQSGPCHEG
jgi:hypothetical protein